jgi:hypothetical protein
MDGQREKESKKRRYARVRRLAATATMTTACSCCCCCGYSSFTSFKKGGAEAGVQRSNQCCRMLANPNITNPNSHLDPRNPQFPSKQCRKRKGKKNFFLSFFHISFKSNRNNEEETKKASASG